MTQETLRGYKQDIRAFLETWPDERLAMLLAHAQDGKLSYHSCCCLIGVRTAEHVLKSCGDVLAPTHYFDARALPMAANAEAAFEMIGYDRRLLPCAFLDRDRLRRTRVIPIIKAIIRQRDRVRPVVAPSPDQEKVLCGR